MRIVTKNCGKFGHPEFSIVCDADAVGIDWLLNWLESEVATGKHFLPNQTIQIGWMMVRVESFEDRMIKICEPDMVSFPIRFIDSVTQTLRYLSLQRFVAESVGLQNEIDFSSLMQCATICNWLKENNGVFLDRIIPDGNVSGWFIGCDDPKHDHNDGVNLELKSLYEIVTRYDASILPYLALPPGVSVNLKSFPRICRNGRPLEVLPNSYLASF
jgi:hypothetical protein